VVSLFRGDLGQPYGGFPPALQKKVLKGAQPLKVRPGEVLPPIDLAQSRAELHRKTWREVTDEEFASYLMYPKVFLDYMQARQTYGQVTVLPTPMFFYGLEPGDEVSVDIERGKTLIVRFVAVSDAHEDGTRTVFFELNGQPRSVKVPDQSRCAQTAAPQGRYHQSNHVRRRAGQGGDGAGRARRPSHAWRRARDDRGDEDGDDGARGQGWDRRGGRDACGGGGGFEGFVGGAGVAIYTAFKSMGGPSARPWA
jgi:pyruvate carboxylase